jgi:hypothetical protein
MFWRRTSVYRNLLPQVAEVIRHGAREVVGRH